MAKICAFFGHRNIPNGLEPRLRELVERAIVQYGVTEFWNGCYGGFDDLAASVVISLKARYPRIKLKHIFAYQPLSSHVRTGFDANLYPDMLEQFPGDWHIPRRNLWMAAQCDIAITYIEHANSRIHEPFDWLEGKKPVFNLGSYQPRQPE
ncbi:MAG: hypothetical protein IKK34_05145 [Clostridia bacterium]|nr:hypothetical protein [Clostridia bacterium]